MKLRKNPNKKLIKSAMNFKPFDFAFLLYIERAALEKMAEYLATSNIAVDDEFNSKRIRLMLRVLDIVEDEGLSYHTNIYVNTNNYSRFYPKKCSLDFNKPIFKADLRCSKAWHLYNLIKEYNMLHWWN